MRETFLILIVVQFLLVVLHDWMGIPGLAHGSQVQAAIGRWKLFAATLINAIFPGVAVAFALLYWTRPEPLYATGYWVLYCAITLISVAAMWYLPYFFGASEKTKETYARMYQGTWQILPERGDNPRPNVLHVAFHLLFATTFCLALALLLARIHA